MLPGRQIRNFRFATRFNAEPVLLATHDDDPIEDIRMPCPAKALFRTQVLRSVLLLAAAPTSALGVTQVGDPAKVVSRWTFDEESATAPPASWFIPESFKKTLHVEVVRVGEDGELKLTNVARDAAMPFGNVMYSIDATAFRGKQVAFEAAARTDGVARLQLWMRVDRRGNRIGFFDNMGDRPVMDRVEQIWSVTGPIAEDAESINIGIMLLGTGCGFVDDMRLLDAGPAINANIAPAPLSDRAKSNLVVFARSLGYVRHFHPSDEAASADWEFLAIEGGRFVEDAPDDETLRTRLETVFRPLGPTMAFPRTGEDVEPQFLWSPVPELSGGGQVNLTNPPRSTVSWVHHGFGQHLTSDAGGFSPYHSERRQTPMENEDIAFVASLLNTALNAESAERLERLFPRIHVDFRPFSSLSLSMPLVLTSIEGRTLPRPEDAPLLLRSFDAARLQELGAESRPNTWKASGDDRATRIGCVILAWNVFQHFYPYFDVVGTDWESVLPIALDRAATDTDALAFHRTLQWMVAQLHDGHGAVSFPGVRWQSVPDFAWDWVEGRLVATTSRADASIRPGDVIVRIDGRPVEEILAETESRISGASSQWIRHRALANLFPSDREIAEMQVLRRDGSLVEVSVARGDDSNLPREERPEKVVELRPGIWYVDLDRIDDSDFKAALPNLVAATGLIFDLRGYPSRLSTIVLSHLAEKPIECARWLIPFVTVPDRKEMKFEFSNWLVYPQSPRLTANVAFITDGRAISYAETYLGMVEHHRLAEIVGSPTAGTNGNVNPISLPGGYGISWTGMKVLKTDGSQHHGVGIQPTVVARRTLAGVSNGLDEYLERAISVVSK